MGRKHEETKELVERAIDELRRGNSSEALVILERTLRQKWHSVNDCATMFVAVRPAAAMAQ